MTVTTRTLARLVGAHLGIDAAPYSANLQAAWLPGDDQVVELDDAATLLATILAAPAPEAAATEAV